MDTGTQNIEDAIYLLEKRKENTFVSIRGTERFISTQKGVGPILERLLIDKYSFDHGAVAAVEIDKAQAMLLVRGNVKDVFAKVITEPALEYLGEYHIRCLFEKRVQAFSSKENGIIDEMEQLVSEMDDYDMAYDLILDKYQKGNKIEEVIDKVS